MSFVVLSNNKNEDEIVASTGSIDKPYQFRNNLSSTFELPANAQVALQSAKVTLDGSIVVGQDNRTFYFFFGKALSHTGEQSYLTQMSDSINYTIKIVLGPDIIDTDSLLKISPPDLAPFLQKALRKYSYHPNLAERAIVVPKYDQGVFVGYTFTIVAGRGSGNGVLPPDDSPIDAYDQRVREGGRVQRWGYAGGDFNSTIQSRNRFGAIATFDVPPLDNKFGIWQVDISGCIGANNTPCVIGLSRDSTIVTDNGQFAYPGNINANAPAMWGRPTRLPRLDINAAGIDQTPFWCKAYTDYAVTFERFNAGAELRLKVYHCVADSTEDVLVNNGVASWKIVEFDYNAAGNQGGAISGYDFVANPDSYEKIQFTLNGDTMTIKLIDAARRTEVVYVYDPTRTKEKNLCPAGEQGRWSLFPVLGIYNHDNGVGNYVKTLTIDQWNGTNAWRPNWTTDGGWLNNPNATWNRAIDEAGEDGYSASNELALRTPLDYGVGAGQNSTYGDYEAPGNAGPYEYKLYQPRLIVSPNSLYVPSNQASMANLLGFPDTPWAISSIDAGTGDYTIVSANAPNIISVKSIFCRLDNFTQQSVNGKKGSRSQIIGHLPRYVQTANANYGPLYLEANNLIYLDLNNPEPMKINSFDISLCYVDETLATTLVGTSIICLHIRQKGSK